MPSRTPGRRALAGVTGLATVLSLALAAPTHATSSPEEEDASAPATRLEADAQTPRHRVTLVTGDVVTVTEVPGAEEPILALEPDGPSAGMATVYEGEDGTYVLPHVAIEEVSADVVQESLFNVDALVEYGYTDDAALPLIVGGERHSSVIAAANTAASDIRSLESLDAQAFGVSTEDATGLWALVEDAGTDGDVRVWLDAPVSVQLDHSVPQIGAPEAWDLGIDGEGVTVAVLDTGVDATHPDLQGQVAEEVNFTDGASAVDRHGHGTHVASTVAGSGAGRGAPGVAPGASIISGKVLSDVGTGQTSWIIDGMEWAGANADVVNMSLGSDVRDNGTGPMSVALDRISAENDVLFVVAAGNSGIDTLGEPASADTALTVGAVDRQDVRADFSTTGPRLGDHMVKPEIMAPGVGIVAARAAGTTMGEVVEENYVAADGTSMATPHVAGAAALLLQEHPHLPAQELKERLVAGSTPTDAQAFAGGAGRVDVPASLDQDVFASPSTMTLGAVRYADPGQYEPVTQESVLHNDGESAVSVEFSATGRSLQGDAIPAEALSLAATEIEIPAGASAPVTLSVDPNLLTPDTSYNGFVEAVVDGDPMRIPFSVYIEPLMYDIEVHATDRNGDPAQAPSNVAVFDPASGGVQSYSFLDGVATVRSLPGMKVVQSLILTPEEGGDTSLTAVVTPDVDITEGDTTVSIDALDAVPFEVQTEEESRLYGGALGFSRSGPGVYVDYTVLFGTEVDDLYLMPTEAPETGTFDLVVYSAWVDEQVRSSPFSYRLIHSFSDGVPEDLVMPVDKDGLAHTTARFHGRGEGAGGYSVLWNRKTGMYHYVTSQLPLEMGTVQEQYTSAGPDVQMQAALDLSESLLIHEPRFVSPVAGSSTVVDWLEAVNNPRLDAMQPGYFAQLPFDDGLLSLGARPFADSQEDHRYTFYPQDTFDVQVKRNGEVVGSSEYWYANYDVPNEPADIEVQYDATRGTTGWGYAPSTSTTWTFAIETVDSLTPISMPQVTYEVLDSGVLNAVAGGEAHALVVDAEPWRPGMPEVTDVRTWVSYDDGLQWTELDLVADETDPTSHVGTYTPPVHAEFVTVRTVATDAAGHSVDETVDRAFGVIPTDVPPTAEVIRVGADDRYETAVAISGQHEPGVETVYVATGQDYADALSGSALAASQGLAPDTRAVGRGPVLLVRGEHVPVAVRDELERLEPQSITVLGGDAAIDDDVVELLAQYTDGPVDRLEGADRYATAATIAGEFDAAPEEVFVATGEDYPDALAAAARAGALDSPVLLVRADHLPRATVEALDAAAPERIRLLGGTEAVSVDVESLLGEWASVTRVEGSAEEGRYGTAAALAQDYEAGDTVFVSTGQDWPDALAGAAWAGAVDAPMLLTQAEHLPQVTGSAVSRLAPSDVVVIGGEGAVSDDVLDALRVLVAPDHQE